jgi:hypothetical protein
MVLDERVKRAIREAVREVDPAQIAITRKLTAAERFAKMASMIEWAERTSVYRLRLRRPELSEEEALHIVRGRR